MMEKPCLIVVTGMPGAGKTTFSRALGEALFLPVISRDQIKEGYVHTFGRRHSELLHSANAEATGIFFETLRLLAGRGVSVVCEAAFQHPLWERELAWFMDKARVYLLICTVDRETASKRFVGRGLQNPKREYFHGDRGVQLAREGKEVLLSPYEEPRLPVPTLHVDTSGAYSPPMEEIAVFLGLSIEA